MKHSVIIAAVLSTVACEIVPKSASKQDTTTIVPDVTIDTNRIDSVMSGVPAVPPDSLVTRGAAADSGLVELYPAQPRRGGVLFVLAKGVVAELPRCSWKGAPLPCYRTAEGIRAIVALPADEPAGTFTLTIERPAGRITRQVVIADRDFGRELMFLEPKLYPLVTQTREIPRDARALRQLLGNETPEQRWNGKWREMAPSSVTTSSYGVERFYYPASDSARSVSLSGAMRSTGTFGADTTNLRAGSPPGWRHSGIDLALRRGSAVRAPAAGLVAESGEYVLSGKTLVIDHGQGVHSTYFHLDTVSVREGDVVRAGAVIGRVGETGLATGPHLHFGIYVHGKDVEPASWYDMPDFAGSPKTAKSP